VSVVVVSWNTWNLLRACLKSLGAGYRRGRLQAVVVDNASADETVAAVGREFPSVALIANERNHGFAAASNQGLLASDGRFILLLNPDTVVGDGAIDVMVRFLEDHPEAGAVGPLVIGVDGVLQDSCFPLPTMMREAWRLFHLDRVSRRATYPLADWRGSGPREVDVIQGACLLLRRSVLESIGMLDERFYIYTEEVDLCRRIRSAGWRLYWHPDASIVHLGGQSTRQVAERMFLELYRSKIQYFGKHSGSWGARVYKVVLAAAAVPRIIGSALLVALVPRRRREFMPVIRNYLSLLRILPTLGTPRDLAATDMRVRRASTDR
jgi:GT2 family glycosyltransferase